MVKSSSLSLKIRIISIPSFNMDRKLLRNQYNLKCHVKLTFFMKKSADDSIYR
jgi:hypothetical protein